jgi:peptide deformylase
MARYSVVTIVPTNGRKGNVMIVTDNTKLEVRSNTTSVEECKSLGLFEILEKELKESPIPGVGLAAIQAGYALRASIIVTDKKTYRMVNPVIIEQSKPIIWPAEGCLSAGGKVYNTDRYNHILVRYRDYDDNLHKTLELTGFESVVIQHEVDHMDGILNYKREHKHTDKPGRNDLCPCGSKKKYKKCCLGKR